MTVFAHPMPTSEELEAFYQGFLYRRPDPSRLASEVAARRRELTRLFGLESSSRGCTFLDHGAGTGVAFKAARDLGLDAHFNELDAQAVSFARDTYGLDDAHWVTDLNAAVGRFDCILSDNVIEHAVDPTAMLATLVAALKPSGTLVVKTPNAAATEHYFYPRTLWQYARTAKRHDSWGAALRMLTVQPTWYCDPPRHLYSFSARSLAAMCRAIGLSSDSFEVSDYPTPLLRNTILEQVKRPHRDVRGLAKRILGTPVAALELPLKALQVVALKLELVGRGGLILKVRRPRN